MKKKSLATTTHKSSQKSLATPKPFRATAAMRLWAGASVNLMSDNITEIATECKVNRNNWYMWLKRPEFLEWYEQERQRLFVIVRQKLDNIGLKMADKDFRYWKAMQKIAGRDVSEDSPPNHSPIQVGIQNVIGEKKKDYGI